MTRGFQSRPLILLLILPLAASLPDLNRGQPAALLCGAIDMNRTPAGLEWVDLLRIDIEPAEIVTLKARDGLFWGTVEVPGRYRYLRFGGGDGTEAPDLVYLFPPEGVSWAESDPARPDPDPGALGQRDIVITGPGLFWLGARRVSPETPTRYHVVTVGTPGEKEALERLLTLIEEPSRRAIVRARLNQIGTD